MKVGDTQFDKNQLEGPVDDVDDVADTRMTVLSPGIYWNHQFTSVEQQ